MTTVYWGGRKTAAETPNNPRLKNAMTAAV